MKVYKKPEIHIEKFTLSKHIAACAYDMNNSVKEAGCVAYGDAAFNTDGMTVFTSSNVACIWDETNEGLNFCYSNGSSNMNVFNS